MNYFRKQAEEQIKFPKDWRWVYSIVRCGKKEADLFLNIRSNIDWIDKLVFQLPFDKSGNYLKEITPSLPLKNTYLSERFLCKNRLDNDDTQEIVQDKVSEARQRIFEQTAFQELLDQMIVYGDEFSVQLEALRSKCKKNIN